MKNTTLEEIRETLEQEDLMDEADLETRYCEAVQDRRVRELLEIETPEITDLTDLLQIENNGRLYAIRMDLNPGVDNHKKPVVAGLILMGVLKGRIPKKRIDTLIDGGNFNSAKALKYYAEKLGMKGVYVMSRLFPKHVTDLLESESFEVIRAPRRDDKSIEEEFYGYLVHQIGGNHEFRRNKYCLWHARDGGKAMYILGKEIARNLEKAPDCVVSCIGAGSTLGGIQVAIRNYFALANSVRASRVSIAIAEHELSPLFARFIQSTQSAGIPAAVMDSMQEIDPDFYEKVDELPHIVIGPHYQEINPLLPEYDIESIDSVVQFSEHSWMAMQKYLAQHNISVGNSSAANVAAAASLASQGKNVVTIIFEPFREFYKRRSRD